MAMQQMVDSLQSSMRLLVASVRSPDDIVALASQVLPCLSMPLSPCLLARATQCARLLLNSFGGGHAHAHNSSAAGGSYCALQDCTLLSLGWMSMLSSSEH